MDGLLIWLIEHWEIRWVIRLGWRGRARVLSWRQKLCLSTQDQANTLSRKVGSLGSRLLVGEAVELLAAAAAAVLLCPLSKRL